MTRHLQDRSNDGAADYCDLNRRQSPLLSLAKLSSDTWLLPLLLPYLSRTRSPVATMKQSYSRRSSESAVTWKYLICISADLLPHLALFINSPVATLGIFLGHWRIFCLLRSAKVLQVVYYNYSFFLNTGCNFTIMSSTKTVSWIGQWGI